MFCPTCGREEQHERKFCIACGTNLERVTKVISPDGDNALVKIDKGFDKVMSHYAGLFFGQAEDQAEEWRVANSWKLLGESFLALLANFLLFWVLLYIALPVRFVVLLFSTPFRLLAERGNPAKAITAELESRVWTGEVVSSITEHTTMKIDESGALRRRRIKSGAPK
ncbi:MAG: zinc ribbon domain-containing protein [Blastocatellia bacterium]